MDGLVAAVVVAVGVDLQVQRKTLHALLRGEVRAQAVDGDEDLRREETGRNETKKMATGVFTAKRKCPTSQKNKFCQWEQLW